MGPSDGAGLGPGDGPGHVHNEATGSNRRSTYSGATTNENAISQKMAHFALEEGCPAKAIAELKSRASAQALGSSSTYSEVRSLQLQMERVPMLPCQVLLNHSPALGARVGPRDGARLGPGDRDETGGRRQ